MVKDPLVDTMSDMNYEALYFDIIAPIWDDFFMGKIGPDQRENQLKPYRSRLRGIQLRRGAGYEDRY